MAKDTRWEQKSILTNLSNIDWHVIYFPNMTMSDGSKAQMSFKSVYLIHLFFTTKQYVQGWKSKSFFSQHSMSLCMSHSGTLAVCSFDTLLLSKLCKDSLLCTHISLCSCLSPEEPDRVLCGCGRQQHAPALRQYAAWTAHHHYLKQA